MSIIILYFGSITLANLFFQKKVILWKDIFYRSTLISTVFCFSFQFIVYINAGYLDPFIIIAIFIQVIFGTLLGICIGAIFLYLKKRSVARQ